ncbi:hypothetical protein BJ166DRAFT_490569 [Pestalotiopsis sp. NC0098]|nr:hypothetical protein BJ166DRAFT_490569 [Pestalotiopsis sp. NC0098]
MSPLSLSQLLLLVWPRPFSPLLPLPRQMAFALPCHAMPHHPMSPSLLPMFAPGVSQGFESDRWIKYPGATVPGEEEACGLPGKKKKSKDKKEALSKREIPWGQVPVSTNGLEFFAFFRSRFDKIAKHVVIEVDIVPCDLCALQLL